MSGRDGSISDQFEGSPCPLASARNSCSRVSSKTGASMALATTMPSYPTTDSTMSVTPFSLQSFHSLAFIRRDAFVMSGWPVPTPAQNSFSPPPDPVDSTTGVGNSVVLPNCSATAVENGKTVDDPTMRIWSRASAAPATISDATRVVIAGEVFKGLLQVLLNTKLRGGTRLPRESVLRASGVHFTKVL